ncbi:NAD-binding protein [Phellopilus nigrolimitatus]|nr:NAD-binding protein [Phellopilus nigrolimitatus]
MAAIAAPAKVLVSGANGFIAVWLVQDLLERGYSVRGTVRAESKATHIRNLFKAHGDKLEIVEVPDITKPGAFDAAVQGVDAIAHTASPFHFNADDPNDVIEPAVKGTVGILESALKHAKRILSPFFSSAHDSGPQLRRIVVLSSSLSIASDSAHGELDERRWNEESIAEVRAQGRAAGQLAKYCASKSLAEKAAWEFAEKHKSEISWDLVALNPPLVFGPILHEVSSPAALNSSVGLFYEAILTQKKTPEELAEMQAPWVDVRDVALGHVRALEVPAAGGQRFILSAGSFIWQDWLDAANELKLPGLTVPTGTPGAGKDFEYNYWHNSAKARTVLGIEFRDKKLTTKDSIESLKARGW